MNFVGIGFENQANCSSMNFMHLDLMTPQNIDGSSEIIVERHNMPAGGSNSVIAHKIDLSAYPNLKAYEWLSIDIPLNTLSSSANIAQLAISGSVSSIYVYKRTVPTSDCFLMDYRFALS